MSGARGKASWPTTPPPEEPGKLFYSITEILARHCWTDDLKTGRVVLDADGWLRINPQDPDEDPEHARLWRRFVDGEEEPGTGLWLDSYDVEPDRFDTAAKAWGWIRHLSDKVRMTPEMLRDVVVCLDHALPFQRDEHG